MRLQHIMDHDANLADFSYVGHRFRTAANTLKYLARDVLPLHKSRNRLQERKQLLASVHRGEVRVFVRGAADSGQLRCDRETNRCKDQGRRQQQKNALRRPPTCIRALARVLGPLDRRAARYRHWSPWSLWTG